jgi:MFS-type transporter involved in bile tolerance (Atg22 family)
MKNYVEFIKWCAGGISLRDDVTRMMMYLGVAFFGSLAFGNPQYWFLALACAIVVDISVSMIQSKYKQFKQEKL